MKCKEERVRRKSSFNRLLIPFYPDCNLVYVRKGCSNVRVKCTCKSQPRTCMPPHTQRVGIRGWEEEWRPMGAADGLFIRLWFWYIRKQKRCRFIFVFKYEFNWKIFSSADEMAH